MATAEPRPFPTALVRDLLGLTRLLYRAEQAADMPGSYERLARLEKAGRAFREAIELARRSGANKSAPRSAWGRAEKGALALRAIVGGEPELSELVRISTATLLPPPSRNSDD